MQSHCTDEGSWMLRKLQYAICWIIYWRSKHCFSSLSFAPSFVRTIIVCEHWLNPTTLISRITLMRYLDEIFHCVHCIQLHIKCLYNKCAQFNMRDSYVENSVLCGTRKISKLLRWFILVNISQKIYIKQLWIKCGRFSNNALNSDALPQARNIVLLCANEFHR